MKIKGIPEKLDDEEIYDLELTGSIRINGLMVKFLAEHSKYSLSFDFGRYFTRFEDIKIKMKQAVTIGKKSVE